MLLVVKPLTSMPALLYDEVHSLNFFLFGNLITQDVRFLIGLFDLYVKMAVLLHM